MWYYHWFIPKFMQVAQPLHELTSGENAGKKKAAIQWDSRCQQAFDDLKRLYTTAPILAYADFTWLFKLHTDACGSGLGTVLYQTHEDGTDAVIAYASRSLTKAESHYPLHKLEFLALKWVVVKKFHEYLYGLTFNMYTDNSPLMYILTAATLDAANHCWVASLVNYNFRFYYQARKTNVDADTSSRVSWPGCMSDNSGTHLKVTAAVVQAVQEAALKGPTSPIEAYSCDWTFWMQYRTVNRLPVWLWRTGVKPSKWILLWVWSSLWDGTLGQWQSKSTDLPEFSLFQWEWNHLLLKQGILYRWATPRESEETLFQLVLPATQREVTLKGCHDEVGHLGLECMLDLMCDWFFWLTAQSKGTYQKVPSMPCLHS